VCGWVCRHGGGGVVGGFVCACARARACACVGLQIRLQFPPM